MANRQARYEERRRKAGNKTVSARLSAEQESVVKTAGGATLVLRAIADAILAGGEIQIIAGEGECGTVIDYDGKRTIPSDGQPDRPDEALKLARQFRGVIDVLYIGPETDTAAIQFMRDLAAAAGGIWAKNDIATMTGAKSLTRKIVLMLT